MPSNRPGHLPLGLFMLWIAVASSSAAPISSSQIAPGVTFETYRTVSPHDVFVLSIERQRPEYELRIGWPGNERNFSARATTTAIIGAKEQAGFNVIAAVNASFFSFDSINITGVTASEGQILQAPSGAHDTAVIGTDRQATIIEDLFGLPTSSVTLPNGTNLPLNAYNREGHSTGQLTLYTSDWGRVQHSLGSSSVALVINELSGPPRAQREFVGEISALQIGSNNLKVPEGGAILLGDTSIAALRLVRAGSQLRFQIGVASSLFNNLDLAVTGVGHLLKDGAINPVNWRQYNFSTVRHPRTVLAWNDSHWFLMVVDGRSSRSVGMTFSEMGSFLLNELGATDAVNLDGGGSSTMVVDGTVRNVPSDGQQRAIANALLLISNPNPTTPLPFSDPFSNSGRKSNWDDKFTFNDVTSMNTPSGDNSVIEVQDPVGGVETVRAGKWGDRNYTIQARVYCEDRSSELSSGYERYALFARDSGTGALGLSSFGGGNCYAISYDSHTRLFQAGKFQNGTLLDWSGGAYSNPQSGWRMLRIECFGNRIRMLVDGQLLADVNDNSRPHGQFGIGYHEFFNDNNLINGTRCDEVLVTSAFGDTDGNHLIDSQDALALLNCASAPGTAYESPNACLNSDLEGDRDVDLRDVALLQVFVGLNGE